VRGKPEKFAEHYNQATLFFNSQTGAEKQHIIRAFRFELTRVQVPAVRARVIAQLRNVDAVLAQSVADGLGMSELPDPLPKILAQTPKPEVATSAALSLLARPGTAGVQTRRVAIVVAEGTDTRAAASLHAVLASQGAVPRYVGIKLGQLAGAKAHSLDVEISMEASPSVLWDAVIIPGGERAAAVLAASGQALEFVKDQYRHCKPILLIGAAESLLDATGIAPLLSDENPDVGLLIFDDGDEDDAAAAFIGVLSRHRNPARETDPPRI
jgi:catalase